MAIIDDKTVGLWFMRLTDMSDWQACLREDGPNRFHLEYRFRYYDPKDPGNDPKSGKDKKNWYEGYCTGTRAEVLAKVQSVALTLERESGHQCDEILMDAAGPAAFMEKIAAKPWAHLRTK